MFSVLLTIVRCANRLLHLLARWALIASITGVLVFTVSQVLDRYIIHSSFSGHDQFARLSLVALTFIGIAVGIRDKVNVRIELISNFVSARTNRIIGVLLSLVTFLLALVIFFKDIRLLRIGAMQKIMGTPFTYQSMYGLAMLGMGLIMYFLLEAVIRHLTRKRE